VRDDGTAEPGDHYGTIKPETVWAPKRYDATRQGMGRYFTLRARGEVVGILFTDDKARLGFLPGSGQAAWRHGSLVREGLLHGAATGATATWVFDWWASLATQNLAADPVQHGPLEALLPPP
jgi:hypothetical protein